MSQFTFEIEHVSGKSNVADHLSRIPGMESLEPEVSCSMCFTLGISHLSDLPKDSSFQFDTKDSSIQLNAIISVYDNAILLKNVMKS